MLFLELIIFQTISTKLRVKKEGPTFFSCILHHVPMTKTSGTTAKRRRILSSVKQWGLRYPSEILQVNQHHRLLNGFMVWVSNSWRWYKLRYKIISFTNPPESVELTWFITPF